jgi:hypothetical protein
MANSLTRIARTGRNWTASDLDAYNIQINTVDTQAFFSIPCLPAPMVDPIILNHINAPVGISLPRDLRLFFYYLHAVTTCVLQEKKAVMTDFSIQLMSQVLHLCGSSCWMPRLMNSIQGEILTSEVCVSVKRSGESCNGR